MEVAGSGSWPPSTSFYDREDFSMQVISAAQARRRFRRIIKLLQEGNSFVITKNGKPACKLVPTDASAQPSPG
ncbi:type II toxin-antitoxin system prevent-host-death family antitoxin [Pseudomonas soli]|uniref:type II toxin-antitoxin system prevent-host-death family antitoxin n=1 Tax=Pseudomonas soli TaxID=1306993 RepID=UPI00345D2716